MAAATSTFGQAEDPRGAGASGGKEAIAQYDYEKAEDNELELRDGERITNIDMVDEDWWMGQNSRGEVGLFPANYVELVPDGPGAAQAAAPAPVAAQEEPPTPASAAAAPAKGHNAVAQYDYEAAEDNELSFPDGATITDIVSHEHLNCQMPVVLTSFHRSSQTRTGGWEATVASAVSSQRTTWNSPNKAILYQANVGIWKYEYRLGTMKMRYKVV
jgi:hypothetical protein